MALHHRVKPHHHVATWAVVALSVVLSSSVYANATLTQAQEHQGPGQHGPSDKTKKFFGVDDADKGEFDMPEVCKREEREQDEKRKQFEAQQTEQQGPPPGYEGQQPPPDQGQAQPISPEQFSQLPPEEQEKLKAQFQAQGQPLDKRPEDYEAERARHEQQGPPPGSDQGPHQGPAGFSPECKKAMAEQAKSEMRKWHGRMQSEFPGKMDSVIAIMNKLSNESLPKLAAAGLETGELKSLAEQVRADAEAMKGSFANMAAWMGKIINAPAGEIFSIMQQGAPGTDDMAKIADRLVNNLEKIESQLKTIAEQAEAPANQTQATNSSAGTTQSSPVSAANSASTVSPAAAQGGTNVR